MTLAKAAFLCSVLSEQVECHDLAFKMGLFGLEIPRQPASTKALEVSNDNNRILSIQALCDNILTKVDF